MHARRLRRDQQLWQSAGTIECGHRAILRHKLLTLDLQDEPPGRQATENL
ncbi:MAG: hypothetical protein ACUVTG_15320 [Candidatus Oleimicrobiaceae bacterium]